MLTQILQHLEPMTTLASRCPYLSAGGEKNKKQKTLLITLSQEITQMKRVWVARSIFELAKSTQSYELL